MKMENYSENEYEEQGFSNLSKLLQRCKIPNLLEVFIKEEVDDDFLIKMDLDNAIEWSEISALLPTVGSKRKFRSAVKEYQVSDALFCFSKRKLTNLYQAEIRSLTAIPEKRKKVEVPKEYTFFNHNLVSN